MKLAKNELAVVDQHRTPPPIEFVALLLSSTTMETAWNIDALQDEYRRRERMKDVAAEDCRRKARAGNENYRQFYDEERAKQIVAMFLKTTTALTHREILLEYLAEMKEDFRVGKRDDKSVFDAKIYRRAAVACIDREIRRFTIA